MRTYELVFEDYKEKNQKNKLVKKLTFPEAAMAAYMTINKLGFNWRIKSVKEIKDKNTEIS